MWASASYTVSQGPEVNIGNVTLLAELPENEMSVLYDCFFTLFNVGKEHVNLYFRLTFNLLVVVYVCSYDLPASYGLWGCWKKQLDNVSYSIVLLLVVKKDPKLCIQRTIVIILTNGENWPDHRRNCWVVHVRNPGEEVVLNLIVHACTNDPTHVTSSEAWDQLYLISSLGSRPTHLHNSREQTRALATSERDSYNAPM
jgi:hypothetical protein